jgi:hypothetical protein
MSQLNFRFLKIRIDCNTFADKIVQNSLLISRYEFRQFKNKIIKIAIMRDQRSIQPKLTKINSLFWIMPSKMLSQDSQQRINLPPDQIHDRVDRILMMAVTDLSKLSQQPSHSSLNGFRK